jgi:hypothetical protein
LADHDGPGDFSYSVVCYWKFQFLIWREEVHNARRSGRPLISFITLEFGMHLMQRTLCSSFMNFPRTWIGKYCRKWLTFLHNDNSIKYIRTINKNPDQGNYHLNVSKKSDQWSE